MQTADRTEINKKLKINNFFPTFFSVLLPELGRPDYVTKCIHSIHQQKDLPVEIILHDDGSGREKQAKLFNDLREIISTFIFNNGHNTGLARSMNRCRAMASSEYLIGFNTDVYVTSSFLKSMKTALDLPYAGIVNVTKELKGPHVYTAPDGTKIGLAKNNGACHCFGIKTERWDEVNGWDENVQTTASDVGFVGTLFGHGYFTLLVEGTTTNEMWPVSEDGKTNIGGTNKEYVDSTIATRGDNNCPPIFGMEPRIHDACCENRRVEIWHEVNDHQNKEELYPQWYNGKFQADQLSKLYNRDGTIDWEFAKEWGHDKHKDLIKEHFGL